MLCSIRSGADCNGVHLTHAHLTVMLLLWLLLPRTRSLYRVLLEFASVASLSAAL